MKTAGLIGGMSWESTLIYYRLMNQGVAQRLGGHHSAALLLASVDFADIEACQAAGEWDRAGELLADTARRLQTAGADFLILCTNTMHKVAPAIEAAVSIPLLHIVAPTIAACRAAGHRRVGLLGTRFTMEDDFCRVQFERAGIGVIVPPADQRATLHRIIFDELVHGRVVRESVEQVERIIDALQQDGADAVVLGCTELGLLHCRSSAPFHDTTVLHARAAVDWALS